MCDCSYRMHIREMLEKYSEILQQIINHRDEPHTHVYVDKHREIMVIPIKDNFIGCQLSNGQTKLTDFFELW